MLPGEREFIDAIWASVTRLYGEIGASLTGLSLIDFDAERKIFVVKCSLASLPEIRSSIACVTTVAGIGASIHVLAVSGTLKALFSAI
jgi:RNase P/RNase MRP subunit POP5